MFKCFLQLFLLSLIHFTTVDARDSKESLQYKWAKESLENFSFTEDDRVLDISRGLHSITYEIALKVPQGMVVGLVTQEGVYSNVCEDYQAANIIYMQGDARSLPFIEQFDKAVAFLSFNWIKEQEEAIGSLYAALKRGGKAIITRPGWQPSNFGPVTERLVKMERWAPFYPEFTTKKQYYTADQYRCLLENAGFIVEMISENSTYTYFEDREALTGFFRPLCTFNDHLSPDLQKKFVDDIVDGVLQYNPTADDGSILLHDFKLEAIVSKP